MEGFEALYSDRRLNPSMIQAAINSWSLLLTIAPPVLIKQLVERYYHVLQHVYYSCCYHIWVFDFIDNSLYYKLYWDQILLLLKSHQARQSLYCLNWQERMIW